MKEAGIQNLIRIALSETCICHRGNRGLFYTKDGRPIQTGLGEGFSDLFGHRISDGRAFYIECKRPKMKPSKAQEDFLNAMKKTNALVGVAHSVEEALEIVKEE